MTMKQNKKHDDWLWWFEIFAFLIIVMIAIFALVEATYI